MSEVVARLSLVVEAEPDDAPAGGEAKPRKFTVWSVPVSMRERRKVDRASSKAMRNVRAEALRAAKSSNNADSLMHGGIGSGGLQAKQRVDPLENLAFADQAVREMTDRKTYCRTPKEEAGPVTVLWTWWTCGPCVVAVVLVVLAAAGCSASNRHGLGEVEGQAAANHSASAAFTPASRATTGSRDSAPGSPISR